jgi:hypothetical protein
MEPGDVAAISSREDRAMPMYFFHLATPGQLVVDDEGMELSGILEAQNEAEASAKNIIADAAREGIDVNGFSFTVTDDHGEQVLVFEFKKLLNGGATG